MTFAQWFLIVVALEEAAAGAIYAFDGNWRKAIIWAAYAAATLAITF
jgi:hypothetical protein